MACNHGRIKSVNCRIFCDICGEELPAEYLTDHKEPEAAKPVKPAENAPETAKKTTKKRGTK
jgi:hypothetical protein